MHDGMLMGVSQRISWYKN